MSKTTSTKSFAVTLANTKDGAVHGHKAGCADLARGKAYTMHRDEQFTVEVASKAEARAEYNADFDEETDGRYEVEWLPCAKHVPATTEAPAEQAESAAETGEKASAKAKATKPAKSAERPVPTTKGAALPAATKGKTDDGAVRQYRHIFAKAMATHGAAVLAFSSLNVDTVVSGAWAEAELRISGASEQVAKAHGLLDSVEERALAAMVEYNRAAEHRKGQTGYQRRVDSRRFIEGFEGAVAARLAGKAPKGSKTDDAATRAGRTAGKSAELVAA